MVQELVTLHTCPTIKRVLLQAYTKRANCVWLLCDLDDDENIGTILDLFHLVPLLLRVSSESPSQRSVLKYASRLVDTGRSSCDGPSLYPREIPLMPTPRATS